MNKGFALLLVLTLVSIIATVIVFPLMPDSIPIHWNVKGEIDRWAGKQMTFVLASMPILLVALALIIPRIDPQKKSYKLHGPAFRKTIIAIGLFFMALHWGTVAYTLGAKIDMPMIVIISIGALLIIVGNFIPQAKHNYTYGIRLPWTLASQTVWKKTHQLGGRTFVIGGIIMIAAAFVPEAVKPVLGIVAFSVAVIVPGIYSFVIFKKEQEV